MLTITYFVGKMIRLPSPLFLDAGRLHSSFFLETSGSVDLLCKSNALLKAEKLSATFRLTISIHYYEIISAVRCSLWSLYLSKHGKKLIIYLHFKFYKDRETKEGGKWRCIHKKCSAKLYINENASIIFEIRVKSFENNNFIPNNI